MWHEEAFHGLGVQDVESTILFGALLPLDGGWRTEGKKKKRRKRKKSHCGVGGFLQGWTQFAGCAAGSELLGTVKH
jgi:hypothetical protein